MQGKGLRFFLAPSHSSQNLLDYMETKLTKIILDGPANTTEQGVPVQLIYGRCLVGSHPISMGVTVDQLMPG